MDMDQYTEAEIVDIDVIMENPFVNSADVGLSNVRFTSLKINTMKHNVIKKARFALFVNYILLASQPLIIMQIPHNFIKHVIIQ